MRKEVKHVFRDYVLSRPILAYKPHDYIHNESSFFKKKKKKSHIYTDILNAHVVYTDNLNCGYIYIFINYGHLYILIFTICEYKFTLSGVVTTQLQQYLPKKKKRQVKGLNESYNMHNNNEYIGHHEQH